MSRTVLLYLIIFLEGYVVLSTELLAIRLTLPFVGSGTDTLSIVIAAVLMPLAVGYYAGGKFKGNIRKKILRNLVIAQIILVPALSYLFLTHFFEPLVEIYNLKNRIALITIYVCSFLVFPIFLLGQTVPLITNYFRQSRLSEVTGKILFFSTFGSFLGAVFTTNILMSNIGVANTASITIACLCFLTIALSKHKISAFVILSFSLSLLAFGLNNSNTLKIIGVVANNAYNTVQIEEAGKNKSVRYILLNRSYSSALYTEDEKFGKPIFDYAQYLDRYYFKGLRRAGIKGNILILGGGGFTLGLRDKWNDYTFVDIDPDLQQVAEKEFLKEKLEENKTFIAQPARAYLTQTKEQYDLVIMDIYRGPTGIPEHLITREAFKLMGDRLKPQGVLLIHVAASVLLDDAFSRALDNTIRSAYPYVTRQALGGFNPWEKGHQSTLYQIRQENQTGPHIMFTDNMNPAGLIQIPEVPY